MNPVLIDLGFIEIYWYSFLLLIAFTIGILLAIKEAKRFDISSEFMINLFFYAIPLVLIGSRLYYVLFNLDYYIAEPMRILRVWEGGLAIHGGIIAGVIFIWFYTRKHKVSTIRIFDILVISLIIGQAIGRWGNFFNSEAYGPVTTSDFLSKLFIPKIIIEGMYIDTAYHHPTFLYESIWCLIGFIIMLIIRRTKYLKIGQLTCFYAVWYGIERFVIEGMRTDSLMLGNIKVAQIISIVMIIVGVIGFIKTQKTSVFKNKYNDRKIASGDDF